ncbi:LVIVD repeat-containing protein [Limnobacter litoralis]|uniref:LVIVD repeat-containing protein n=1 Tax=Limnobacter litoralis TaxID=481366 RepID=A0ABQ5YPS0_9BURK|nr:hypothetical protein [Limnobacter litoralis]GLR26558.1 hypothetical protein GCM10007875_16480 [Limnobacter litoralis]
MPPKTLQKTQRTHICLSLVFASAALLSGCGGDGSNGQASVSGSVVSTQETQTLQVSPVQNCSSGDLPEGPVQGRVPIEDRTSGRSEQGYNCNLKKIGQFQGEGASWVNPVYKNCAYMATAFAGTLSKKMQGVQVVDVSKPEAPAYVESLTSTAFQAGTWESLKVNPERQLLAGVAGGPIEGLGFIDIYDISGDCTHPRLLNGLAGSLSVPANFIGHEGNFSPDGNTYWSTSSAGGTITAIDISKPASPRIVYIGNSLLPNHGFSFNADGTRMYLTSAAPAGVIILDVSDIQNRKPLPIIKPVGQIFWQDGNISQHTIPVFYQGKPRLIVVDEFGTGATRILDISDETKPTILSKIRLQIQQPAHVDLRQKDLGNNGLFGYEAHYCSVDRTNDPQALACGYFQSGVRVFDIRNPLQPKEIAYYNPPAQTGKTAVLPGSEHAGSPAGYGPSVSDVQNLGLGVPTKLSIGPDLSADWCSSPPEFRGNQLWVTCQDNGFMVLQFERGVYPFQ